MLCPKCGTEIADDATSCPQCRYRFDQPSTASITLDTAAQERQVQKLLIIVFLGLAAVGLVTFVTMRKLKQSPASAGIRSQPARSLPVDFSQPIVPPRITVQGKSFAAYPFAFPSGCRGARVVGSFSSPPGSGVQLLLFRSPDFEAWKRRQKVTALYQGGSVPRGNIAVSFPSTAGRFEFVVSNPVSRQPQVVQSDLTLHCSEWAGQPTR